jgi:Protein of unknown function (DUF3455)
VVLRYRLTGTIVQAWVAGLLAGCAAAPALTSADIPAPLRVAGNYAPARQTRGTGVQIYDCRAGKDDAARFEWLLKEPEADLFDRAGKKIGRHYSGPTWEAKDGSKVMGEVVARLNSPEPGAIAWLLLSAKANSGSGIFSDVRFIQRLRTVGGNAPSGGCDRAAAGSEVRVPYSAEYWFYADKP